MNPKNQYYFCRISDAYDLADKDLAVSTYARYMLSRTQQMFKYTGLPSTIPQRELELQLQMFGHVGVFDYNGELFALRGAPGGEPTVYYLPSQYIISSPALKMSKTFTIDEDLVVIRNDSMFTGLTPMFLRYATQLTENDLSMLLAIVNSRIISLLIAGDDAAKESAEKYLADIKAGKMGVIGDSKILEAVRTQPYGNMSGNTITQLIEAQQYLKAGWFNELGLNANYNMKREAINSEEAQMNHDALYPLIDDMLQCRKECLEKVNNMFGTSIDVEFNSVWEVKHDELEAVEEAVEDESITLSDEGYFSDGEPEADAEPVEEVTEEEVSEEAVEEEPLIEAVEELIEDVEELIEEVKDGEEDESE